MKKIQCALIVLMFLLPFAALASNPVIATIPVGANPAGIAITPDGRYAYVANNNNNNIPGAHNVSVIDLQTNTVITIINDASFDQPYTVTINPAGTKAYVTNSYSTTITIIDIATNTVIGVIDDLNGPSGMAITSDGTLGYVNNYGAGNSSGSGNTVNLVDLTTNTVIGLPINVALAPAALALTPDGSLLYIISYVDGEPNHGKLSVMRTSDNVVFDVIAGFSGPFAIAITPNGKYAYITNFGSNNFSPVGTTVSVVSLKTNTIVETITLGTQPSGLAITPNGRYAYVSNYNTLYLGPDYTDLTAGPGTVNIIDLRTGRVLCPTISVGLSPDAIAISPNGERAYATNYTSNTVSVIKVQRSCGF